MADLLVYVAYLRQQVLLTTLRIKEAGSRGLGLTVPVFGSIVWKARRVPGVRNLLDSWAA